MAKTNVTRGVLVLLLLSVLAALMVPVTSQAQTGFTVDNIMAQPAVAYVVAGTSTSSTTWNSSTFSNSSSSDGLSQGLGLIMTLPCAPGNISFTVSWYFLLNGSSSTAAYHEIDGFTSSSFTTGNGSSNAGSQGNDGSAPSIWTGIVNSTTYPSYIGFYMIAGDYGTTAVPFTVNSIQVSCTSITYTPTNTPLPSATNTPTPSPTPTASTTPSPVPPSNTAFAQCVPSVTAGPSNTLDSWQQTNMPPFPTSTSSGLGGPTRPPLPTLPCNTPNGTPNLTPIIAVTPGSCVPIVATDIGATPDPSNLGNCQQTCYTVVPPINTTVVSTVLSFLNSLFGTSFASYGLVEPGVQVCFRQAVYDVALFGIDLADPIALLVAAAALYTIVRTFRNEN